MGTSRSGLLPAFGNVPINFQIIDFLWVIPACSGKKQTRTPEYLICCLPAATRAMLLHALGAVTAAGARFPAPDSENDGGHQHGSNNGNKNDIYRSHISAPVHARTMILNRKLTTHARTHCQTTSPTDHFQPSSRLTDAIAATHGV